MIDILLATYNGEKYIEQQLYSIITQTYRSWNLIIHDDGSTDMTVEIIKRIQKTDERIIIVEDGIKCGGPGANFMHLLKNYSNNEYVIFCDQDDIWFENKVEILFHKFNDEKYPKAVFSSGYLYNPNKGILGDIPSPKINKFEEMFFVAGGLQGCSLMFNKKLADLAKLYNGYVVMHDFIITLLAVSFGKLFYVSDKLMLYRQGHEEKVTSNVGKNKLEVLLKNKFPVIDEKHNASLVGVVDYFFFMLTEKQRYKYSEFQKFCNSKSVLYRICIVLKNGFTINKSTLRLVAKILLRQAK